MQTEMLFQINADGTFQCGATRSVGGGDNGPYGGAQWSAPQYSGVLSSDGKNLYLLQANGQTVSKEKQLMATFFIEGNNMATTAIDGVKEYWKRQ